MLGRNQNNLFAPSGFSSKAILLFLVLLFAFSGVCSAQKKEKLAKNYKEWLEQDVPYIITKDEKDNFLRLTTDEARDKFIEEFWDIRNPNPGSQSNSYKDEYYERIAFTNARYGVGTGMEGWRTDRGRTYITLGPPQQKQAFRNNANLYPIEIWFYSNANSALPPFFYVMFYQRDGTGEYRYYSPYNDGPAKLATGVEAINSPAAGLKMITDSVGADVARISLSLLPDEPVDMTGQTRSSLSSDILLSEIKGYANLPSNRDDITRKRMLKESVSSRLIVEGRNLDIVTFPVKDSRGLTRLDYLLRLRNPSDLTLVDQKDGRLEYSVEVRVRVFGPDNKLIFTQQKSLSDSIDSKSFARFKNQVFGYEGLLPLPPGAYHLDFQFTDWAKKTAYHTSRDVTVPAPAKTGLLVPAILPFLATDVADPALADLTPFSFAGVRFTPISGAPPVLAPETNLQVMYQIWAPPQDPRTLVDQKLAVEYALGKPAVPGSTTTVKDEVIMSQFDPTGSLISGKKLSLEKQFAGNYLLTISVTNPATNERGYASANFKILDAAPSPEPYDVLEPAIGKDAETGVLDQQRALCYLFQGHIVEAREWFRRALQEDHANDTARARLVDAYFSQKDYAAVVSLYSDAGITDSTDSETLLRVATSLQKTGKISDAISMLERALKARPDDGPLYIALGDIYGQIGNDKKAAELTRKGKSYLAPAASRP